MSNPGAALRCMWVLRLAAGHARCTGQVIADGGECTRHRAAPLEGPRPQGATGQGGGGAGAALEGGEHGDQHLAVVLQNGVG